MSMYFTLYNLTEFNVYLLYINHVLLISIIYICTQNNRSYREW